MRKKVFMYVGHSNWGKSRALKQLTGGSSHQKTVEVAGYTVRVRKMSNDDDGHGLLAWADRIPQLPYQRFVIAFCPKAPPVSGTPTPGQRIALEILLELQETCDLYFFVQAEKYNQSTLAITSAEREWLRNFGTVHVLAGQHPDMIRAQEFARFIQTHSER